MSAQAFDGRSWHDLSKAERQHAARHIANGALYQDQRGNLWARP